MLLQITVVSLFHLTLFFPQKEKVYIGKLNMILVQVSFNLLCL